MLGHHTGSAWNCTTACKAHERGNPLSTFEPHLHSTSYGILAEQHSELPLVGLHILSLSLFSLVFNL